MSVDRVDPSVPPIHPAFEQAAQLIEKLSELRRQYAHPGSSAFDHINIECDAMLTAADKLRHPDNAVLTIPTWLMPEWEAAVSDMRAAVVGDVA